MAAVSAFPSERKVPVVYYLSKNGHLEHPHYMEVSLNSPDGLHLRDVINRLNFLRGKGFAGMYSWSSKRSYKNGFVWHDLSEGDLIHPSHGNEYVLKGSELLHLDSPAAAPAPDLHPKQNQNGSYHGEYRIYRSVPAGDAATQTDDGGHRRRRALVREEEVEVEDIGPDEISPPPSSSSSDSRAATAGIDIKELDPSKVCRGTGAFSSSGRMSAPAVLKQLISCGSISVKDREFTPTENAGISGIKKVEDKYYFSGSLIKMKKKNSSSGGDFAGLRRCSSFNAET